MLRRPNCWTPATGWACWSWMKPGDAARTRNPWANCNAWCSGTAIIPAFSAGRWPTKNGGFKVTPTEHCHDRRAESGSLAGLDPPLHLRHQRIVGRDGGFTAVINVQGFNYNIEQPRLLPPSYSNSNIIGTETSSLVSDRGIYTNDTANGYVWGYDIQNSGVDWGSAGRSLVAVLRCPSVVFRRVLLDGL